MVQLTRWLLAIAVVVSGIWIAAVVWTMASPQADAASSDEPLIADLRAELDRLAAEVAELRSTLDGPEGEATPSAPTADPANTDENVADDVTEAADTVTATAAEAPEPVTVTPTPEPVTDAGTQEPIAGGGPLDTNGQDLYSCYEFATWREAQTVYEANLPGDPNYIDTDHDGIACERLLEP